MKIQKKIAVLLSLFLTALLATLTSCKRLPPRPDDLPTLYPTKITVTFGGQRVEDVAVILMPIQPELRKWKSGGKTDAQGCCEVKTAFCYQGAPEGQYRLAFSKLQERLGDELADMQPLSLIPMKYLPMNTELTLEIKPEKNEFLLELDGGEEVFPVPKGATPGPKMKR
ncbi:MAG: hypothetical protein Q4G03_09600 [Planctomycetia bacterium]|nr:hypothetical protein [Planctomycetia bacterium]